VQADTEGEAPPLACCRGGDGSDFLGDLRRRLAPGEVLVDRFGRDIDAGIRRAAEIERWSVFLEWSEGQPGALDGEVLSALADFLARQQVAVDAEELGCDGIALVVSRKTPSPLLSTGSPPVTTLINRRPPDSRSSVAVMRAARVGESSPGRTATRKRSLSVSGTSAEATSQESSQERPVGNRTPK